MVSWGSEIAFTALVLVVALQRLWELRRSARNEAIVRAAGGKEHAASQMPWMRAVHAAWLVGMLIEVWAAPREVPWSLVIVALCVLVAGQALRLAAMSALGDRWTVKIMTLPGAPVVATGPFRWLRHPNYLGVVLEIAALPLVHGAVATAAIASLLNAVLLVFRIRAEERALQEENGYDVAFAGRPRLIPTIRGYSRG